MKFGHVNMNKAYKILISKNPKIRFEPVFQILKKFHEKFLNIVFFYKILRFNSHWKSRHVLYLSNEKALLSQLEYSLCRHRA